VRDAVRLVVLEARADAEVKRGDGAVGRRLRDEDDRETVRQDEIVMRHRFSPEK
jgi:hypothetical protein